MTITDFGDDYKVEMLEAEEDLSKWEHDFIESIKERLEEGKDLTIKQKEKLDQIFKKYA